MAGTVSVFPDPGIGPPEFLFIPLPTSCKRLKRGPAYPAAFILVELVPLVLIP